MLDKKQIQRGFSARAASYESASVLQRKVAGELFDRLDLVKLSPGLVLDLGCGSRLQHRDFSDRFKGAKTIALDLSIDMLLQGKNKRWPFRRRPRLCADAETLPFCNDSIDLVYSNLMLQWCDARIVFAECRRVLRPGGLFVFSSFGPDTLWEMRQAWNNIDERPHVHVFPDMHDLGDWLGKCGFAQTVMDCDRFILTYTDVYGVMRDLRDIGAVNATEDRRRSLTGKGRLQQFVNNYESIRSDTGEIPATYEVVYGHAWIPDQSSRSPASSSIAVKLP